MRLSTSPFAALPPATRTLILFCLGCYGIGLFLPSGVTVLFGLVPALVSHGLALWQPFTYMFLHGSFFHLLFNVFALWMFGGILEELWGAKKFTLFYFACGLGAAALHILLKPHSAVPVIGASGAIYGLLAAFAVEFPAAVVYLYFFFPVKARTMAIVLCVVEFLASFNPSSHIANLAHLGGLFTGLLILKGPQLLRNAVPSARQPHVLAEHEANAILEKVRTHGVSSLTNKERRAIDAFARKLKEQQ
ncbi:MAG TPA: rhomboid family intramembrane serine protease [Elusimicrobiales bacterium]|nr:rhomboid family intramembrane serine protease [Elusimicrobiales bacterium]